MQIVYALRHPHLLQLWSWGVNDGGALGRLTDKVPISDSDPETFADRDTLESTPGLVQGLEGFRVVRAAGGDSISLAISDKGNVKYWGSFRVSRGSLRAHYAANRPGNVGK